MCTALHNPWTNIVFILCICKFLFRMLEETRLDSVSCCRVGFHITVLVFLTSRAILLQGAFKKFCNWTIKRNGNVINYTLFSNIIPTELNAFATFFWQTVNSSKIEIFCLSLQTAFLNVSSG